MRFGGEAVIVTGASRGIGRAIAIAFAREGARVAVNYQKDKAGAEETVESIRRDGGQALAIQADVSQASEVEELVGRTEKELGPITVLVNNAATFLRTTLLETDEKDWDRLFAVNVRGPFLMSRAVARKMIERRKGAIINVSSILATVAVDRRTAYCASKGALNAFTRALALEMAPFGIRVNAIAPGLVATNEMNDWLAEIGMRADFERYVPWQRLGTAEEIAQVAVFLASDESNYMVGAVIPVDGALSAREAVPRIS
ncbi:MAG: 3-oxoacyl-ACP reductase FabG [Chloroflexi bacterium]|nr:3-oxoacyl-ACP reductase FabG [Chloroflexota bacterium]MCL5075376.1 3-oxoacyl-ACP reductase FabG [Chloroflexota bacterium]